MGIKISGEMLNHMRFSNDMGLITDNPQYLQKCSQN